MTQEKFDIPAFPTEDEDKSSNGLTKLEYFTAAAMQGLLAMSAGSVPANNALAERAIEIAQTTLSKLP